MTRASARAATGVGAARAVALLLMASAALVALASLANSAAAGDAPPPPRAGIVPLELAQVAKASGPELRIPDPPMALAGKRVRFVGKIDELKSTPDGQQVVGFSDGSAHLLLRFAGLLEDPARLGGDKEWEVIARLDRPVTLADGGSAIAVPPDALVKTPAPPSEVRPGDVLVGTAGAESFVDPKLPPWESSQPLYRVKVLTPGVRTEYTEPGASALATVTDENGKSFVETRAVSRAADGRQRAVRCQYRLVDGRLRNLAYGTVDLAASGERTQDDWVDFEDDEFHDKWSARKRHFPPNTYAGECLSLAISGFPFGEARVVRFYVWGDKSLVPMYAYLDGEETIDVRGRAERAQRVKIGFDVREAAKTIDLPEVWRRFAEAGGETWFAGESTYWVAADPPHDVLRFRGLVGAAGSGEIEVERTR